MVAVFTGMTMTTRVKSVTIPVADQDQALRFYTEVLGFEAGAVTALAVAASAVITRPGVRRTAELRFGHPFAVVAVAAGDAQPQDSDRPVPPSPWHGLPVFSAWVADPEDAAADLDSTS